MCGVEAAWAVLGAGLCGWLPGSTSCERKHFGVMGRAREVLCASRPLPLL